MLLTIGAAAAFYVSPSPRASLRVLSSTMEEKETVGPTFFEDLVQAVDCASHFGKCDLAVLDELALKVEGGSNDCTFEDAFDGKECQHEMDDRKALANMLRMQSQLRHEMASIESNLFVKDVREENNIRERDLEMELLEEDSF